MEGAGPSFEDWLRRADEEGLNLLATSPVSPPPGCASVFPVSQPSISPDVLAPSSRAQCRGFRASALWIRPDRPLSKPSRPSCIEVSQPEPAELACEELPSFSVSDPGLRAPRIDWGKKQIRKHLGPEEYHRRQQTLSVKMKELQSDDQRSQQRMLDLAAETRRAAEETLDSALWQKRIVEAVAEEGHPTSVLFPKRPCPRPGQSATGLGQNKVAKEKLEVREPQQENTTTLMPLQQQQELQRQKKREEEQRRLAEEEKQRLLQQQQQPKPHVEEVKAKHWDFLKKQIKKIDDDKKQESSRQDILVMAAKSEFKSDGSNRGNRPSDKHSSLRRVRQS